MNDRHKRWKPHEMWRIIVASQSFMHLIPFNPTGTTFSLANFQMLISRVIIPRQTRCMHFVGNSRIIPRIKFLKHLYGVPSTYDFTNPRSSEVNDYLWEILANMPEIPRSGQSARSWHTRFPVLPARGIFGQVHLSSEFGCWPLWRIILPWLSKSKSSHLVSFTYSLTVSGFELPQIIRQQTLNNSAWKRVPISG